jgi:hypothetical protein
MKSLKNINYACCGMGINSVAYIIECTRLGIKFDVIGFANTGIGRLRGEKQATYDYIQIFNQWLVDNGQPKATIIHTRNQKGRLISLYDECYRRETLPAIVFGFKTCSQGFKLQPQDKYIKNWLKKQGLSKNTHITKYVGYDIDEEHRIKDYSEENTTVIYPLVTQEWGRFECVKCITEAGLPIPPKSAYKFCPSTTPYQVVELYNGSRSEFYEAAELERNAIRGGKLNEVVGLGRHWSWWDLIKAYRYFELVKRYNSMARIHPEILKLVKKINRSKPPELKARLIAKVVKLKPTEINVCDLFTNNQETPCGCYDGAA